jgi:hypothetical protein
MNFGFLAYKLSGDSNDQTTHNKLYYEGMIDMMMMAKSRLASVKKLHQQAKVYI